MQLFDRPTLNRITRQIADTTSTDHDRAALILQETIDYGPASEHFNTVLPILWEHVSGIAREAVAHAQAVEEAVASDFAASIDHAETADRMFAEHPDLKG